MLIKLSSVGTNLTQEHPRWVGAWWIGFLVCGIAALIIFIPMLMLPKHMKPMINHEETQEEGLPMQASVVPKVESGFSPTRRSSGDFKGNPYISSIVSVSNHLYITTNITRYIM